jgi:hypothetical protein
MSLIIQPGLDAPSVANMVELARKNSTRRVNISLLDAAGTPIDIDTTAPVSGETGALDLTVTDLAENVLFEESYFPRTGAPDETSRIVRSGSGQYYIDWGGTDETDTAEALLFNWHSRQNATAEDVYRTQVLEVISSRTLSLLPTFRLLIDRSIKPIIPEKYCFVGVTDSMLILFLKSGLNAINNYQPYPVFIALDSFPIETHSNVLMKAALYEAVLSQLIFAIDTDVPSFQDGSHSFVQAHAQNLAPLLNALRTELDNLIPKFKLHFVNSGTMSLELHINYAYAAMLTTAPGGTTFRGIWQGGPLQ